MRPCILNGRLARLCAAFISACRCRYRPNGPLRADAILCCLFNKNTSLLNGPHHCPARSSTPCTLTLTQCASNCTPPVALSHTSVAQGNSDTQLCTHRSDTRSLTQRPNALICWSHTSHRFAALLQQLPLHSHTAPLRISLHQHCCEFNSADTRSPLQHARTADHASCAALHTHTHTVC